MFYSEEIKHKIISGGFGRDRDKILRINKNLVLCAEEMSKKKILDMVLKWNAYMKISKTSKKRMCEVVSQIFHIPSTEYKTLLEVLKIIRQTPNTNIIKQFIISNKIFSSLGYACKEVFFEWVAILEFLIGEYIKRREKVIGRGDKPNNVRKIRSEWDKKCKRYNINSSSEVLLFNGKYHNTRPLFIDRTIIFPSYSFKIAGIAESAKFERSMRNFIYMGFCPCEPLFRLNGLLQFPISELILAMDAIEIAIPNFENLYKSLKSLNFHISKPKKIPKDEKKKISIKGEPMIAYVEEILNNYILLQPVITSYEKYFDDISRSLIKCSNVIKKWKLKNII